MFPDSTDNPGGHHAGDRTPAKLPVETVRPQDAAGFVRRVTDVVARRIARRADHVWSRNDIARVLVETLIDQNFDFNAPTSLEQIKQLLVETYRIAGQTIPADRLRIADFRSGAGTTVPGKGISL